MTLTRRSCLPVLMLMLSIFGCSHSEHETEAPLERSPSVPGVHLSEPARSSIGLETAEVRGQDVQPTLSTTGWLTVKPSLEVVVKAAATGFVLPTKEDNPMQLGLAVSEKQTIGTLQILLSPQEEAQLVALKEEADILILQSLATLQNAEAQYEQVKDLQVMAGKDIQAIHETIKRSRAAYEEAREKLPFLPPEPYQRPLRLTPLVIESPMKGRITAVYVQPRQFVVQGDPLCTLADWSSLWVRAPVFEGDLLEIDQEMLGEITSPKGKAPIRIKPTLIPQPTREGRRTVDLFYDVDNSAGLLRPGQAVSVSLPKGKTSQRMVIPQSAIIWDGMGNPWVYVPSEKNIFRRQRVQLGQELENLVVVEQGLSEGQQIVSVGAEALYGEEFKSQIELDEERE